MIKKKLKNITILQSELFNRHKDIFHFITLRYGGVSEENYSSLNCGLNSGDLPENVLTNRKILAEDLKINENDFIFPDQQHTNKVKIIKSLKDTGNIALTDALVTKLPGKVICVTTADCVPVILFSPRSKVAAVIHAGWRGQVSMIIYKTVELIKENFKDDPSGIIAFIGPCISREIYEVGDEVLRAVENTPFPDKYIKRNKNGKGFLDIAGLTYYQLIIAGLKEDNIESAGICTYRNNDFFSARRDGFKTGRFVTGIMIKK